MNQQELNAKKIKDSYKDEFTIKETINNGNIILNMTKGKPCVDYEHIMAVIRADGHIDWY